MAPTVRGDFKLLTGRISGRILSGSRPQEFRERYLHVMLVLGRNRLTKCTSSDSCDIGVGLLFIVIVTLGHVIRADTSWY
jgi:hypothetical protein